ncbi:methyltransferase family protein [Syntrophomonas palmitatica]|uniref:methyltransferase family protein n=1 Tax=Syntrophomonas palmitatica TaxID=402877 RepID=UPI0006CFFAD7|nr:isoprenylcysteine carboxylmethyltransferase family protein [Syntrophomonas palmitatica]
MEPRLRNVLIRMFISVAVFIYIGYLAWQRLSPFDFWVIMAFFGVYLTWSIIETIIYKSPDTLAKEDDDRKSYIYLQFSSMAALFYALVDFIEYHFTRNPAFEPAVTVIGFVVFLVSCVIRYQAIITLGKYYNPRVSVYEEHSLITRGIYRNIRHPIYVSAILNVAAIAMIFNSWGALILAAAAVVPAVIYRINVEEEFLLKHFDNDYKCYMEQSKKLIPKIW